MLNFGGLVRILTALACFVMIVASLVLLALPVIPPSSPLWDGIRVKGGYPGGGFGIGHGLPAFDFVGDVKKLLLIILTSQLHFPVVETILCSLIALVGLRRVRKLWRDVRQFQQASAMVQNLQDQTKATTDEYNDILSCLKRFTHRPKPSRRIFARSKARRGSKDGCRRRVGYGRPPACNKTPGFESNLCIEDRKQHIAEQIECCDDTGTSGYSSDDTRDESIPSIFVARLEDAKVCEMQHSLQPITENWLTPKLPCASDAIRDTSCVWENVSQETNHRESALHRNQLLERISQYEKSIVECVQKAMALRKVFKGMSADRSSSMPHCYDCCVGRHNLLEYHKAASLERCDMGRDRVGLLRESDGFPSTCPIVQQINERHSAMNLTEHVALDVKLERISSLQKKLQQDLFRRPYLNDGRLST